MCWAHGDAMLGGYWYAGPRGDAWPRGDTAMLGLEETLDLGGDTATLGSQGDAGPPGDTATLLRWGLEETLDLGVTLLCWGASRRRWASRSRWCHWASCGRWCQWAPRRRWTSGDAGAASRCCIAGAASRRQWTLRRCWCRWASCGRWCCWAPRRRWTLGDAGDAGLEETMDLKDMVSLRRRCLLVLVLVSRRRFSEHRRLLL